MAKPSNVRIGFEMVDPRGTEPLRLVAQHAEEVGDAWIALANAFDGLAAALDDLCSPPPAEDT